MVAKERLAIVYTLHIKKTILFYSILSLSLGLIVFVYERFSFGVTSFQMRFSILIPILFGLVEVILKRVKKKDLVSITYLKMGMFTLILALFLYGVFEIYGTVSPYILPLYILGGLMTFLGVLLMILEKTTS
jgi:hypothetical protein